MNKDDITKLARQAEGTPYVNRHYPGVTSFGFNETTLLAFAKLVAAAEREACAGLAERRLLIDKSSAKKTGHHYACKSILADIRARGTT